MSGEINTENTNQSTRRVMQLASAVFGVCLIIYSAAIFADLAPRAAGYLSDFWTMVVCVVALVYGVMQIAVPSHMKQTSWLRYVLFYIILGAYAATVSGFQAPITYLWAATVVSSYIYFGGRGTLLCVSCLAIVGVLDTALNSFGWQAIGMNILTFLAIWAIGATIILAVRGYRVDQRDLEYSRAESLLQHDRLMTLVNNLADAIISVSRNGEITLYNAAALNLLDTNVDIDGSFLDDVLKLRSDTGKSFSLEHELLKLNGLMVRDDLTLKSPSGDVLRLEVVCSAIRSNYDAAVDEELGGYIVILRDITKAKSLEEERDEFISVVSHELRTPITIAEGTISNAQLLVERGMATPEKLTEAVGMAHEQVMFLARMVNDLSTLSRAERGVADAAEEIDIRDLINDLYTEYMPEAEQKGLHLDLHMPTRPGRVFASRLYLKELLQNFVTNAIKYTKAGTVTIDIQRRRDGTVILAVKDTGIGISKSDQKRIFDKFYRAEDYRTRETNGTGLGLYVADKLARKLGVRIELKSRLNHGSVFSITLPEIKRTPKNE